MATQQERIHAYLAERKDDILRTLERLIRVPSVKGAPKENAPFGQECADALALTEAIYRENGFETQLDEEGKYLLASYGEGKTQLGIFAHSDVVPVGDDWMLTSPFEPIEKDGYLIGRGSIDNKSAIVISLYCAKAIKELSLPFRSRLLLFTGANEESGMGDIRAYVGKHTPPDFALVADTAFPVYRGDKGIFQFTATQLEPMQSVTEFAGGSAFNIILGKAEAKVGGQTFAASGISRHGALPEGSLNAGYVLAKKLQAEAPLCPHDRQQLQLVERLLEKYYGEIFGIENDDPDFGKLTVTNGFCRMKDGRITLGFDMRYGCAADIGQVKQKINTFFQKNHWTVEIHAEQKPFAIAEDHPLVAACMQTYRAFAQQPACQARINAGGTYARHLPCAVETGTTTRFGKPACLPDGHGGAHQPDECISISGLMEALELNLQMILACDKEMNP